MNINTSKNQTVTGVEADSVVALAVVGAAAILVAAPVLVYKGFDRIAWAVASGSWKK